MELNSKIQIKSVNLKENRAVKKQQVSFSAITERELLKMGELREVEKNARKYIIGQPWFIKLSNVFSKDKYKGDIANVIITGLGTGIIAPLMIKYNPLSKEDKDTKTYAAWRQPISAVIAVVTQVGITKQVGNFIKKVASSGYLGEEMNLHLSNRSLRHSEKYWDIKDELAIIAERKEIKLQKYLNKKYTKLQNIAEKLRTEGGYSRRLKIIEEKANEIKEIMNDPVKSKKFFLDKAEQYSKKAVSLTKKATDIKNNVNRYSDVIGIGLALVTLPLTCGLLNWIYPRFMKMAFPELSCKKEQKKAEGVASNNPQTNAEGVKS